MESRALKFAARAAGLGLFALFVQSLPPAFAQSYPERPIRLIVPLAPGGGNDAAARLIAGELGKRLGQQVVVDNRPGGGSIIASQLVLSQPADGHTLAVHFQHERQHGAAA